MAQWMALQGWVFEQKFFRENLKLGEGGLTGDDNRILEETYQRTGVTILGKRMFDGGERHWPERRRSTLRSSCSPVRSASLGSARAERPSTS